MATANDVSTLNGLFKEVYADKIQQLIPEGTKLLQRIPFVSKEKQGGLFYNQPVVLGLEHGITFAASDEGAFNLNAPISGVMKNAQVKGSQLVLRSALSYESASRSVGAGPKAFQEATKFLVGNMLTSVAKVLEKELLYGQVGYGTLAGAPSANVATITTAEWAPGIWAGAEGMPIEIRSSGGTLRGETKVVSVDLSARTLTLESTPVGATTNDVIWFKGAYGKEFAGIHKIFTNTTTLFGIDASQYNLWKANSYAPGSPSTLSFAIIQAAIAKGVEKGLDNKVLCLVNPSHWDNLLTEQAAFRMYDSSYKSASTEAGSESIKFFSQNGEIEILPSIYVKEGYAYCVSLEDMVRVGSTDVTFKRPGQGDNFFRDMEDNAGYELRAYTDQALFCAKPGKNIIISNLTV